MSASDEPTQAAVALASGGAPKSAADLAFSVAPAPAPAPAPPVAPVPPHAAEVGPPGVPGERALGVTLVVASGLCYGVMPLFARRATADGVDTPTLLLLRFGVAAVVMWTVTLARRIPLVRGRVLATLVGMGAVGYAGQAFCYFSALRHASAGLVALLLYLYPALVTLLSWLFLRHRLTKLQLAAVALALAGSALTVGRAGDGTPLGVTLGVLAALIYSVYIVTGSRLPSLPPALSTAVVTSGAAVVYGVLVAARGPHLPTTPGGWAAVLALGVVGTVSAVALFLAGLARVGPVRASVYSCVEPVFTVALGVAFLGEHLGPLRVVGGAAVVAAVVVLARAER
jgi:drug/metabolite transporter (DMT)-like permease